MNQTRYFKDRSAYWKFRWGQPPLIKTPLLPEWTESVFQSVYDFLSTSGEAIEITVDEAESAYGLDASSRK